MYNLQTQHLVCGLRHRQHFRKLMCVKAYVCESLCVCKEQAHLRDRFLKTQHSLKLSQFRRISQKNKYKQWMPPSNAHIFMFLVYIKNQFLLSYKAFYLFSLVPQVFSINTKKIIIMLSLYYMLHAEILRFKCHTLQQMILGKLYSYM